MRIHPGVSIGAAVLALLWTGPVAAQQLTPSRAAAAPASVTRAAYVDLERLLAMTTDGKAVAAKLEELRSKKASELMARRQQIESMRTRLASMSPGMSEGAQLQRDFERAQVSLDRFTEDAQTEVLHLQGELRRAFGDKMFPVLGQIAKEKGLSMVFTGRSLVVWYAPKLDITDEVARRMDAAAAKP